MKTTLFILSFTLATFSISSLQAQTITPSANGILYVNIAAIGNGSGNSWANAVPQLADALKWARTQVDSGSASWLPSSSLKIFVAKGTYKPMYDAADGSYGTSAGNYTDNAFVMVKNVQLYGGFDPANGIDSLSDTRIYDSTGTILDGEMSNGWISTHVVIAADNIGTGLLDGFTIQGGSAVQILSHIVVNGDNISRSTGGGICIAYCSPTLENLIFTGNTAQTGGAIFDDYSSPIIRNVLIVDNYAKNQAAGIKNKDFSAPTIINTTIANNINSNWGGGIVNSIGSIPKIYNSIIYADSGLYFNNIWNQDSSTAIFKNSIIGGGTTWSAAWGTDSGGNIALSSGQSGSIFKDTANNNFSLNGGSPAINAGSNSLYTGSGGNLTNDVDLASNPRLNGGTIDLGPYEYYQWPASVETIHNPSIISVYPNPAKDNLTITGLKGNETIKMIDMSGRLVRKITTNQKQITIKSLQFSAGIYNLLIVSQNGEITSKKVIKD